MRQPHYRALQKRNPRVGFVEVHSENFFNLHDASAQVLLAIRARYPVSLHGVGLAPGSACGLEEAHLDRLAALVHRIDPVRVSDHACFARGVLPGRGVVHANDLLPLPFTRSALRTLCRNVHRIQDRLQRPILLENLSAYLAYSEQDFTEPEFFSEVGRRTGCGLLLDLNNLMVNALNADAPDPLQAVYDWLDELARKAPAGLVGEIHLAGHRPQQGLVIDNHAAPVSVSLWLALDRAIRRFGRLPVLIEWDQDLPELSVLLAEARHAQTVADSASPGREDAWREHPATAVRTPEKEPADVANGDLGETARQGAVLRALFTPESDWPPPRLMGLRGSDERRKAGLSAYRTNALAHAARALRIQFPTVADLLGDAAFQALCTRYWYGWPPTRGDLAWLGETLPECLEQQDELKCQPWLADCARLDWACWRVQFEPPPAVTLHRS